LGFLEGYNFFLIFFFHILNVFEFRFFSHFGVVQFSFHLLFLLKIDFV